MHLEKEREKYKKEKIFLRIFSGDVTEVVLCYLQYCQFKPYPFDMFALNNDLPYDLFLAAFLSDFFAKL